VVIQADEYGKVALRLKKRGATMYLRPDEVARVLENSGFERDFVDDKAYGTTGVSTTCM